MIDEIQIADVKWQPRGRDFDAAPYREPLLAIFAAVRRADAWDADALPRILAQHPRRDKASGAANGDAAGGYFSKIELVEGYRQLTAAGLVPFERWVQRRLQMKPVRTASGVAPVTVLTEPAGCPGRCIFCPDAAGMPKSYLPDEPAARRAAECGFDPYLQVRTRLATFETLGHTADKVELLILGGTWSAYSRQYREWFVKRCLDAMNEASPSSGRSPTEPAVEVARVYHSSVGDLGVILSGPVPNLSQWHDPSEESLRAKTRPLRQAQGRLFASVSLQQESRDQPAQGDSAPTVLRYAQVARSRDRLQQPNSLAEAQARNETAAHRNVGLVIETRPDWITPAEIRHLRQLGVTKVQLGVQSLDDRILALNQRGHDVEAVRRAVELLRAAGFKLHLHWMPNLYGATPDSDREDFVRLWSDPALRPDELKIYPCSIIEGTELHRLWQAGAYRPYTDDELIDLVADCKATIPPYCRVSRVFRDIPADDIVVGVKSSNLRQLVHRRMVERGQVCRCIRCREVRDIPVVSSDLRPVVHTYETTGGLEHFLSYETAEGRLAGFLRLSLPSRARHFGSAWHVAEIWDTIPEIAGAAMIREVHVYGPALEIGADSAGEAQHLGLGRRLIAEAKVRAAAAGFDRLVVISAIGTRRYYEGLGFERGELYMTARM
ncbi:MAG: tRNA uridine(34) 5-carboxymethylaminomethyl modification radical SAM/GNAT enzyme Elp3 [Chloroflexi bacterium]|nr:tRNA uridine(34) 5-carboxymethylaminomethyl modification radical SAM/GNAT enzyme Elp3 [Chloroflexota bacterium]